jgi:hypothetical protein
VIVQVFPGGVTTVSAGGRQSGLGGVPFQPPRDIEMIELLTPDHSRERPAHDRGFFVGSAGRSESRIVLVGFASARIEDAHKPIA